MCVVPFSIKGCYLQQKIIMTRVDRNNGIELLR